MQIAILISDIRDKYSLIFPKMDSNNRQLTKIKSNNFIYMIIEYFDIWIIIF